MAVEIAAGRRPENWKAVSGLYNTFPMLAAKGGRSKGMSRSKSRGRDRVEE